MVFLQSYGLQCCLTVLARVVSFAEMQHEIMSCASEGMLTPSMHAVTVADHATVSFQAL